MSIARSAVHEELHIFLRYATNISFLEAALLMSNEGTGHETLYSHKKHR